MRTMAEIINKGLEIAKEGLESLKNIKKDKREYKEYLDRIKALPADYGLVFEKTTGYMWSSSGGGDGYDMLAIQSDLLELFETSAADGRHVLEVTGKDVAAFCDELLRNAKTYADNRREVLNRDIMKKLGNRDPND